MIVADYREKKVIKYLDRKRVDIRPLVVADFIISEKCVLERKTGSDFVKSIMEGRIFRQAKAMNSYENAILVIEERDIFDLPGIHPNALMGAITSLIINYGMSIICTKDAAETARLISGIEKKEGRDLSEIPLRSRKIPKDNGILRQFLLEGLPDIGPKMAKRILKRFKTPLEFFNASKKEMQSIKGLGKRKVEKIRKALGND